MGGRRGQESKRVGAREGGGLKCWGIEDKFC